MRRAITLSLLLLGHCVCGALSSCIFKPGGCPQIIVCESDGGCRSGCGEFRSHCDECDITDSGRAVCVLRF